MYQKKEAQEAALSQLFKGYTTIFVLTVLQEGPSYGYAIAQEIARRSEKKVEFKQGTLYPLLRTLEAMGLVESEEVVLPSGRWRRVYTITDKGRLELETRLDALEQLNSALHAVQQS